MRPDDVLTIAAAGQTITTSGTSQSFPIPNGSDGNKARYCLVSCLTNGGYCFLKLGAASVTCTANDIGIGSTLSYLRIATQQFDNFAVLQGSAAAIFNIVPLEP